MRRIELGDFLLIAEIHTGIDAKQLARMPRVLGLAEAALAAPFAGFGEIERLAAGDLEEASFIGWIRERID